MKKKILCLSMSFVIALSLAACGKDKDPNTQEPTTTITTETTTESTTETPSPTPMSKEEFDKEWQETNSMLLKENRSLDTGRYLVEHSVDIANDDTELDKYVYIKGDNITFITPQYITNDVLYGYDDNCSYAFTIFENNEENKLSSLNLELYENAKEDDPTLSLNDYNGQKEISSDGLNFIWESYNYSNDVKKISVYSLSLILSDDGNGNIKTFTTIVSSSSQHDLSYSDIFNMVYKDVNIVY